MKKVKYILLCGLATLALASCNDLTLEPKGVLDDSTLLPSEQGVKTYLTSIYAALPIEDFRFDVKRGYFINRNYSQVNGNNFWDAAKGYQSCITTEAIGWPNNGDGAGGTDTRYWPYPMIHDINVLLQKLPNYKADYPGANGERTYNSLIGEARFLRAFYYFSLAKRYGGVPVVDSVLMSNITDPVDKLDVPRNTEYDTWMFIHDDLQFAIDNMVETSEAGRANKYVAAALMSRAMLYAGTIAKYGSYTTTSPEPAAKAGLVGIPADKANYFFTEAYNAAKLFDGSGYELYGEGAATAAEKEQNYVDLFLTSNKEDIFIKQYDVSAPGNMGLVHNYDLTTSPKPMSPDVGADWVPTYESVQLFQKLPVENADGTPTRFNTREELWQNGGLEPRLLGTVFFSGMELRGFKFDMQRGIYKTFNGTVADAQLGVGGAPINNNDNRMIGNRSSKAPANSWLTEGTPVVGANGCWGEVEDCTSTGFFVRKYVDYHLSVSQIGFNNQTHPWKVFRYAEVLLNRAEAAYELGNKEDAYQQIARIRDRAGATVWTPAAAPAAAYIVNGQTVDENLEFIREERERELMFENHRWWDIRRWRVADQARLDGNTWTMSLRDTRPTGLMPYYVESEKKYIFLPENNAAGKSFNFEVRSYYESLPADEINMNKSLVQNPIY